MPKKLPENIHESHLVDISKLNLSKNATNRVAMKISEVVLSEYASNDKPTGLVLAGNLSNILDIDLELVGLWPLPRDFLEKTRLAELVNKTLKP